MIDLNFKVFGEGEPILILHGLFGMLDNWQTIGKKLAEHHQVFLIDLRNHGRSPHQDLFHYQIMAEDVEQFMLSQWIHQATVIGHSMGAKVAIQLADNQPDMVERLISVDMGIKENKRSYDAIFDALRSVRIDAIKTRSDAEALLAPNIPDPGIRLFLMKNLTRTKDKGYQWKMNLEALYHNYNEILKPLVISDPFPNPALFMRGQKSNYILDDDWPELKIHFPDAKLATIPDAGHWVHADQPDLLLSEIREWMGVTV